jgi:hypothetical protein|nr:MAG TPA: hypothetical protein [Caudoviricetes sp.]
MQDKWKNKAEIGIIRLKNASEIQSNMISRLHTIFPAENEEAWIKQADLLADCILSSSYEIQKAARKIKGAAARMDDEEHRDIYGKV